MTTLTVALSGMGRYSTVAPAVLKLAMVRCALQLLGEFGGAGRVAKLREVARQGARADCPS